jgi:hypothetical protein
MSDDVVILGEPVRYGCRVCLAETDASSTVCARCLDLVLKATGGDQDRHVRQYIADRNRRLEADTNPVPPDLRPIPMASDDRRQRCACGQFYSREIAVAACEARGHTPLPEKKRRRS